MLTQCMHAMRSQCADSVQVAASRASQTLPDFTPQAIANIMWAFAILAHNPGQQLLEAVSADVYKRLDDFSPQHIAVTLWAFGKLEASPGAVLLQVCPCCKLVVTLQPWAPQVGRRLHMRTDYLCCQI